MIDRLGNQQAMAGQRQNPDEGRDGKIALYPSAEMERLQRGTNAV